MIETYAQDITKQLYEFHTKVTDFQVQMAAIVDNIEGLQNNMEGIQEKLDDDLEDTEKTPLEWSNI